MTPMKLFKSTAFKYAAIAALPIIALFYWQIFNFASLALGESVLLETRPVDPTDFLRGDYVILDYKISDIPEETLPENLREPTRGEETNVYVTLDRDASGIGTVKSVSTSVPPEFYIKGELYYGWSGYTVNYGIGVYYVPEGTGGEIEDRVRNSKVLVDVRIFRGNPVIKGLKFLDITDEDRAEEEQNWNDDSNAEDD